MAPGNYYTGGGGRSGQAESRRERAERERGRDCFAEKEVSEKRNKRRGDEEYKIEINN